MGFEGERVVILRRSRACTVLVAFAAVLVVMLFQANPAWAAPQLTVNKTDSPDPVKEGGVLTYTIDVTNIGNARATAVRLEDNLPGTVKFISVATTAGNCPTKPAEGALGSGDPDVVCNLGSIAPGDTETVTIKVRPTLAEPLDNTATATADGVDPVTSNERTTVVPNLSIRKQDTPDPVDKEDLLLYTISVTNDGSTTIGIGELVVIDELPIDDVRVVDINDGILDCDRPEPLTGRIRCENTAPFDPDDTATIKIIVDPENAGTLENTAEVRANGARVDSATETTIVKNNIPGPDTSPIPNPGGTPDEGTPGGDTTDEGTPGGDTTDEGTPGGDTTDDSEVSAGGVTLTCEQLIKLVEEGGAGVAQYSTEVSQRCEGSANVIDRTIPGGSLADTGGSPFWMLMASVLLVGGGLLLRATLRR